MYVLWRSALAVAAAVFAVAPAAAGGAALSVNAVSALAGENGPKGAAFHASSAIAAKL